MTDPEFVIPFENLPERFAESIRNPPPVPSDPTPAATIVLLLVILLAMNAVAILIRNRTQKRW